MAPMARFLAFRGVQGDELEEQLQRYTEGQHATGFDLGSTWGIETAQMWISALIPPKRYVTGPI